MSVGRGLQDRVRLPLLPQLDQQLEDLLPVLGERPHLEVVDGQVVRGNADLGRRLAHLLARACRAGSPRGSDLVAIENAT